MTTVGKYGRPTLLEEVEGRVEHEVTLQQKLVTRSKKRRSDLHQFNYECTCKATKAMCIHIALVLLSEFSKPEDN